MQGEEQAWQRLAACDPQDVCSRAVADYSAEEGGYVLRVLGLPVFVDLTARALSGSSPESEFILTKAAYFSRLSILHYLLGARDIAATGRLVGPADLKTAQIYMKGSHLLPLDRIAARFSSDPEGFFGQAAQYCGERREYGDVAVELRPFPRVPVVFVLWLEDDEFPARSYLLFDETCEEHLPPDILWSVAMFSSLAMLRR